MKKLILLVATLLTGFIANATLSDTEIAAIKTNDFSKITTANAINYYDYAYANTNTAVMTYLFNNKLMSEVTLLKGAIHISAMDILLNYAELKRVINTVMTAEDYADFVNFISTDAYHMQHILIFSQKENFKPDVLIPGIKQLAAAGEYGAVSMAYFFAKGETDSTYLTLSTEYKKCLDQFLIKTLEQGYKTLKWKPDFYIGYNNVVVYALRSIRYNDIMPMSTLISKIDSDFYRVVPFPHRVMFFKDVAEYCNNIYVSQSKLPNIGYVAYATDEFYGTSLLDIAYTNSTGEVKLKTALYSNNLDKMIDSYNEYMPTNFSYKRIK